MNLDIMKHSKILIADDEPANLGVLLDGLRELECTILLAQNGETALEIAHKEQPDMLLLDILMPGMGGFEVARRVHENAGDREIPMIMFITALNDASDKVRGFKLDAVDFITKPFQRDDVIARVSTHLGIRKLQHELQEKNARLQQEIADRRRADERYKSLFEAIPDDAFVLDREWRYAVVNRSSWKRTTFTEDDIIGHKITDVYPQITASPLWPAYQSAMQKRISATTEAEFVFETGEKGWYELRLFPVPDGILVISRDITERKLTAGALQKSEVKLRAFIDSASSSIGIYDENLYLTEVNTTGAQWWPGQARDELIGQHITELVPNVKDSELYEQLKHVIATGKPFIDYQHIPSEQFGELIMEFEAFRMPNGLAITTTDITEKRRIEKALWESERGLAKAQQIAHIGSWKCHLKTGKMEWSDEMYRIYGVDKKFDLSLENRITLVHPDDRTIIKESIAAAKTTGESALFECRAVLPDGTEKVILVNSEVILNKEGEPVEAVGTNQDITAHKQAETQIKAALREKEALLAEIHHRVKNNLQIVSSMLNFQTYYTQDEQTIEVLRDCERRVHSMAMIHAQLYCAPDLAQIDFAGYVENLAAELFAAYRTQKTPSVFLRVDIDDVFFEVKQAIPCGLLINELMSNALKYAFPADWECPDDADNEIRVALSAQEDGRCVLIVSDNGIGLPPDFTFPNEDTLGMFLIETFTEQLDGTVAWQNEGGTKCTIMFTIDD
ncbi:MAG: PAS domain-containing protein [bacterium]|nr:PAS domain-containing protein [bacterium]